MLQKYCAGKGFVATDSTRDGGVPHDATPSSVVPSNGEARFGKLLLLLPSASKLNGRMLQENVFRRTPGQLPLEDLLEELVKSNLNV
jgi:hypothetical protein